jgi:hypothetical protein
VPGYLAVDVPPDFRGDWDKTPLQELENAGDVAMELID